MGQLTEFFMKSAGGPPPGMGFSMPMMKGGGTSPYPALAVRADRPLLSVQRGRLPRCIGWYPRHHQLHD